MLSEEKKLLRRYHFSNHLSVHKDNKIITFPLRRASDQEEEGDAAAADLLCVT
jgi:hypothetical protein